MEMDINILKHNVAMHVSVNELRSAMEEITSNTMISVDNATSLTKKLFDSEIVCLKHEIEALKQENNLQRCEITSFKDDVRNVLPSNFNDTCISNTVSKVLSSNLDRKSVV